MVLGGFGRRAGRDYGDGRTCFTYWRRVLWYWRRALWYFATIPLRMRLRRFILTSNLRPDTAVIVTGAAGAPTSKGVPTSMEDQASGAPPKSSVFIATIAKKKTERPKAHVANPNLSMFFVNDHLFFSMRRSLRSVIRSCCSTSSNFLNASRPICMILPFPEFGRISQVMGSYPVLLLYLLDALSRALGMELFRPLSKQ